MSEENKNTNQETFSLEEFYIELPGGGLVKTKLKPSININNGEGENSIVQKMEEDADPNIAKGKNDIALGRSVEVDSRTLDEDGNVIDPGDGAFSHGTRNKNYGKHSAQFGTDNENHSEGGFQTGRNNKTSKVQHVTQFGQENLTEKNHTTQFGSGHEAGRDSQTQFGLYSKGKEDTLLEVGNGKYYYKADLDAIDQIVGKYYREDETNKYIEITEENKQVIWDKLLADDKYRIYDRKNAFEIKEDGSAELESQGQSPNSIVLKETLDVSVENLKKDIDKRATVTVNDKVVETFDADTKLDKATSKANYNRVYAIDASGNQFLYNVADSVLNASLVARTSTGQIKVKDTPEADNDATSKKYVDDQVSDVREVAEGKTKSFTVDTLETLGGLFGINTSVVADEYAITTTTVNYKDQSIELKQGDLFLIVDTNVPDYWVSVDDMTLYKMETTKVDLTEYAKIEALDEKQNKVDENLNTENKEVIGAINELKENIDNFEIPDVGSGLTEEEKAKIDKLIIDGTGDKFLANDGKYKDTPVLYRHYVSFTSYYEDGEPCDSGMLVIPTSSKTSINKVEELKKYIGSYYYVVALSQNREKGFAYLNNNYDFGNDSINIEIGYSNLIISGEDWWGQKVVPVLVDDIEIPNDNTKQNKIDENLTTESKEVVGAINELDEQIINVREVAEGKTKSFTVDTLGTLGSLFGIDTTTVADEYAITTTTVNYKDQSIELKQGDLFLIVDVNVPDYWISVDAMKLYKLETTKVDLTGYATTEDLSKKVSKLSKQSYAQVFYQYTNSDGSVGVGGWKLNGSGGIVTNNDYSIPKNNYSELKRAIREGKSITDFSAPCGYVDEIAVTKLDAYSGPSVSSPLIYGVLEDGTNGMIPITNGTQSNHIPMYSEGGTICTEIPRYDLDCANKSYVDHRFNGANKAISFRNYSEMITHLLSLETSPYTVGQNIMIVTLNVPDLWISDIVDDENRYEYTSDEAFLQDLNKNGEILIGHHWLSALETQKVDLTEYATNEVVDGKLDKVDPTTLSNRLSAYTVDPVGNRKSLAIEDKTVCRVQNIVTYRYQTEEADTEPAGNGVLITSTPIKAYHSANKKYVDDIADTKLNKNTAATGIQRTYIVQANGNSGMKAIATSTAITYPSYLAQYFDPTQTAALTQKGVLLTNTPQGDYHCANKQYVDNKFNGANKAVSFNSYPELITSLLAQETASYSVGQNIMIVTLKVPDLWVSEVMEEKATYEYVSDTDFTALLETQGYVQVGYYKLSALETQKVDLTEYAKLTATKLEDGSYSLALITEE